MRTRTRQQALYALADYILRPNKERKRGDTAAAAIEITELLDQLLPANTKAVDVQSFYDDWIEQRRLLRLALPFLSGVGPRTIDQDRLVAEIRAQLEIIDPEPS